MVLCAYKSIVQASDQHGLGGTPCMCFHFNKRQGGYFVSFIKKKHPFFYTLCNTNKNTSHVQYAIIINL